MLPQGLCAECNVDSVQKNSLHIPDNSLWISKNFPSTAMCQMCLPIRYRSRTYLSSTPTEKRYVRTALPMERAAMISFVSSTLLHPFRALWKASPGLRLKRLCCGRPRNPSQWLHGGGGTRTRFLVAMGVLTSPEVLHSSMSVHRMDQNGF